MYFQTGATNFTKIDTSSSWYANNCVVGEWSFPGPQGCSDVPDQVQWGATSLDSSDFPSGSTVATDFLFQINSNNTTFCTRLFDLAANAPVDGSETCQTASESLDHTRSWNDEFFGAQPLVTTRVHSQPVPLTPGHHDYVLERMVQGDGETVMFPDDSGQPTVPAQIWMGTAGGQLVLDWN